MRILAASRGPLEPHVAADRFRVDLAYRLSHFAIDVPPLRERREDLPLLIQAYVNRFCHETGKRMQGITVKAMSALVAYDYPGNLDELENIARQLVYLFPSGQPVDVTLLPEQVRLAALEGSGRVDAAVSDLELERLVAATERSAIREALRRVGGQQVAGGAAAGAVAERAGDEDGAVRGRGLILPPGLRWELESGYESGDGGESRRPRAAGE